MSVLAAPRQPRAGEDAIKTKVRDLLDLIRHTATDGDIIQAMAAARAFLEA